MRRTILPISALPPWCLLNGVVVDGVTIQSLGNGQGSGMVANRDIDDQETVFIKVPRELVLCQELVWETAKSDLHLRQVLEASGDLGKTPRGAIIIFLLMQMTATSPDVHDKIGVPNPFTDYIKFLPDEKSLPSRWSEAELMCLNGTTLENHMKVKIASLERHFNELKESTAHVPWCEVWWWSEDRGIMTFEDFKIADAMFRSRAMDFGEHGLSLVPVMDMANHDNSNNYIARFEIDHYTKGGLLPMQTGRYVKRGYEITINYGSERSASDMLHSYGFIEPTMKNAGTMFVSLPSFDDDPLAKAKQVGLELVPGVKFGIDSSGNVSFHSPCLWAMVVNEEDGLRVEVAQTHDGEYELQFFFHEKPIETGEKLQNALKEDLLADLFELRAYQPLVDVLEDRIQQYKAYRRLSDADRIPEGVEKTSHAWKISERLRKLEYRLICLVVSNFRSQVHRLSESNVVRDWLSGAFQPATSDQEPQEDLSYSQEVGDADGAAELESYDDRPSEAQGEASGMDHVNDWDNTVSQTEGGIDGMPAALETLAIDASQALPDSSESDITSEDDSEAAASTEQNTARTQTQAPLASKSIESAHPSRGLLVYQGRMRFVEANRKRQSREVIETWAQERSGRGDVQNEHVEPVATIAPDDDDDFT